MKNAPRHVRYLWFNNVETLHHNSETSPLEKLKNGSVTAYLDVIKLQTGMQQFCKTTTHN